MSRDASVTLPWKTGDTRPSDSTLIAVFEWKRPSISSSWICTSGFQRSTNCAKLENDSRVIVSCVESFLPPCSVLTSTTTRSTPVASPTGIGRYTAVYAWPCCFHVTCSSVSPGAKRPVQDSKRLLSIACSRAGISSERSARATDAVAAAARSGSVAVSGAGDSVVTRSSTDGASAGASSPVCSAATRSPSLGAASALAGASASPASRCTLSAVAASASRASGSVVAGSAGGGDGSAAGGASATGSALAAGDSAGGVGDGAAASASVEAGTLARDDHSPVSNSSAASMMAGFPGPSGTCARISSAPASTMACIAIEIPVARAVLRSTASALPAPHVRDRIDRARLRPKRRRSTAATRVAAV